MSKRLEALKLYKENEDSRKDNEKIKENNERKMLINKVLDLKDRISELIETANECVDYGIEIDSCKGGKYYNDSYENGTFVTNGISHNVGFVVNRKDEKVKYIGIDNGGWNGEYDFITDGYTVEYVHEEHKEKRIAPSIYDLNKFLNGFDKFETMFYKYVDEKILEAEKGKLL